MKALLVQLPHYFGETLSRPPSFFPIGLGQIATYLENAGHDVQVLDIWAHQMDYDTVKQQIQKIDFDVVGMSAFCTQYNYTKWLANELKKCGKPIILGNALATFSSNIVLDKTDVDYCVISEGEKTIIDLLDNLDDPRKVQGISYKEGDKLVTTDPRPPIDNLDDIPFPTWHKFPMEIYLANCHLRDTLSLKSLNVVCGRGCPYNCHYCSRTFAGMRLRSVENIGEEIAHLKKVYNIKGIFFNDELVLVNKKRSYELSDKMKSLGLKWQCQGRVDVVDYDMLMYMKNSGCIAVGYGIETGSQTILNNMNKRATIEQAEKAIRATYKADLLPIIQMMFGYPGENDQSVRETREFFERTKAHYFSLLSVTTPLPGSQLYTECMKKNMIPDEEEFLKSLDEGYSGARDFLINFTDWTDEELYRKKHQLENYLMRVSKKYHYLKYVRRMVSDAKDHASTYGLANTLKLGLAKVRGK